MRGSWTSEQEESILKASMEAVFLVDFMCDKILGCDGFLHCLPVKWKYPGVLKHECADGVCLTHIRCGPASTRETVDYIRLQSFLYFVLERKHCGEFLR